MAVFTVLEKFTPIVTTFIKLKISAVLESRVQCGTTGVLCVTVFLL